MYLRSAKLMILFAFMLAGFAACGFQETAAGGAIYRANCMTCHGRTGAGDGKISGDLPVAPANLRMLAANNGAVFPTEQVMATIYGYRGKRGHALMPEYGSLLEGPQVIWTAPDGREILTPAALVALVDYLETLQDS